MSTPSRILQGLSQDILLAIPPCTGRILQELLGQNRAKLQRRQVAAVPVTRVHRATHRESLFCFYSESDISTPGKRGLMKSTGTQEEKRGSWRTYSEIDERWNMHGRTNFNGKDRPPEMVRMIELKRSRLGEPPADFLKVASKDDILLDPDY